MPGKQKRPATVVMLVENISVPADPRVWREARALQRAGLRVCIICPQGEQQDRERTVCIDGIHIYRYRLSPGSSIYDYIKEYSRALLMSWLLCLYVWWRHGLTVVHAANPPDLFCVLGLFFRLCGKKYVFDQHDLAPEIFQARFSSRWLYRLLRWLELCSYSIAHLVITTNMSQQHLARTRGHCPAHKLVVVRNGPELSTLSEPILQPKQQRYLLAYVGVMGAQDGVEYALLALAELIYRRERRDVELVLIGDGDQFGTLQALASSLQIEPYVTFTGWLPRDEIQQYLATCAIGLSPDPSNPLNDRSTMLKTLDYMAQSLPVVAFDLPETRYSAQDAALYATPNEVKSFADQIERLLNDEQLRLRMGARGHQRIVEELCWEQTKEPLLHAYDRLLAEGAG